MQDVNASAALDCCREDGIAEVLLGDNLRATEREQDTSVTYALESLDVQARIAFQGIVQGRAMLCKCRWVKNDEVVLVVGSIEELESILTETLMARVTWEVQLHVGIGQLDCFGATINGMYQLRSSPHSIERKASRVAEHVEHGFALRILFEQGAVFPLVNEEARFLST